MVVSSWSMNTDAQRTSSTSQGPRAAVRAGVSVTWYTWLEQGRDIRVSANVLENLGRVLRLTADERAHLFRLAGHPLPPAASEAAAVPSAVRTLLTALEPFPAHARD